ncbi:hypothetical protein [Vibrio sp. CyArs1]|uniref:hypothetical protein n=1 Tax=Vibrio sp. CyArs1 TaxID=2682577 RepID=UPI001F050EDC|nr:hypothetical protein [Vibrio sp. CyArs1]
MKQELIGGVLFGTLVSSTVMAEVNGDTFKEFLKQDAAHCFGWSAGLDIDNDYTKLLIELSKGRTESVKSDPNIMEEFGTAMGYSEAMIEFSGKASAEEKYRKVCTPIKQKYGI